MKNWLDKFWTFLYDVFSENGKPSSKRILGSLVLLVCLYFTGWLISLSGATQVVENLIQTEIIISATLLGISNITDIWKGNSNPRKRHIEHPIDEEDDSYQDE